MRIRLISFILLGLAMCVAPAMADSFTISFTAGDIEAVMSSAKYQDPLSDGTFIWGLWSIWAMPIVQGGGYSGISGSVDGILDSDYWTYANASSSPFGSAAVNFYLEPASEHYQTNAHPLYFISDQQDASSFQSYAFDNQVANKFGRSTYLGVCDSTDDPGCNITNVLPDEALYSFSFSLDSGASLLGWQFLVDGSKYYLSGMEPENWINSPSLWVEDFIGGGSLPQEWSNQTNPGDGLNFNVGNGYQVLFPVPEPSTIILVGLGFAAIAIARRRG